MRTLADVLLVAFCIVGCLDRHDEPHYDRTPDGFQVRQVGAWHGEEKATVYDDFDYAVKRAALELEQTEGIAYGSVLGWAGQVRFDLHGGYFFRWQDGLYTGLYWPTRHPEIWIAYYPYGSAVDPADIPLDAPAWSIYQGTTTGLWYWAVYDSARMFPAMAHELAWRFGISHKAGSCQVCMFQD